MRILSLVLGVAAVAMSCLYVWLEFRLARGRFGTDAHPVRWKRASYVGGTLLAAALLSQIVALRTPSSEVTAAMYATSQAYGTVERFMMDLERSAVKRRNTGIEVVSVNELGNYRTGRCELDLVLRRQVGVEPIGPWTYSFEFGQIANHAIPSPSDTTFGSFEPDPSHNLVVSVNGQSVGAAKSYSATSGTASLAYVDEEFAQLGPLYSVGIATIHFPDESIWAASGDLRVHASYSIPLPTNRPVHAYSLEPRDFGTEEVGKFTAELVLPSRITDSRMYCVHFNGDRRPTLAPPCPSTTGIAMDDKRLGDDSAFHYVITGGGSGNGVRDGVLFTFSMENEHSPVPDSFRDMMDTYFKPAD
jgi:hypothetical protein